MLYALNQAKIGYNCAWEKYHEECESMHHSYDVWKEEKSKIPESHYYGGLLVFDQPIDENAEYCRAYLIAWHKYDRSRRKTEYCYGAMLDAKEELMKFFFTDQQLSSGAE